MGSYFSRCWNPPTSDKATANPDAAPKPVPENGAHAVESRPATSAPAAKEEQAVGVTAPRAASADEPTQSVPNEAGAEPGSATAPRVDTGLSGASIPIIIADDDDGIAKGGSSGYMAGGTRGTGGRPPSGPPRGGGIKRRFMQSFGRTNEE